MRIHGRRCQSKCHAGLALIQETMHQLTALAARIQSREVTHIVCLIRGRDDEISSWDLHSNTVTPHCKRFAATMA